MQIFDHGLPNQTGRLFLTDGGLETSLIFLEGEDLPLFASFVLLDTPEGREKLKAYYRPYADLAVRHCTGFVLESPTWRSNPDWGTKLGYSAADLERVNLEAIKLMHELAAEYRTQTAPFLVSGCIGPRGDGYVAGEAMTVEEARDYHAAQARAFATAGVDMISAITMTTIEEGAGVALAAKAVGVPSVISFTVETDGRLPSGDTLAQAIRTVENISGNWPAYYMINCAHPTHFMHVLEELGPLAARVRGLRANASRRSHAELDESTDLDAGDPQELGQQYHELRRWLPVLAVVGGCCGTDHRHVEAVCHALQSDRRSSATA